MDIDRLLQEGDDWNGFELSEEQKEEIDDSIPEDERGIWNKTEDNDVIVESKIENDDSSEFHHEQMSDAIEQESHVQHEGIDEENNEQDNLSTSDQEIAKHQLDMAKIYIEMGDVQGARTLLESVIVDGSDDDRVEAKNLFDQL
ncbi:hypothetical protein N9R79_10925, partial [Vibrio sp.]|nr:hypothetical protein [Vibrio sp.]